MYTYLKGILQAKGEDFRSECAFFTLDVHGVGYSLLTTSQSLLQSPAIGEEAFFHVRLIVREDLMQLVGFTHREERDLFDLLQSASGVGVKVALSLLSALSVPDIIHAIMSEQFKTLTIAKGIGPKLAQKITIDLKEKIKAWSDSAFSPQSRQKVLPNGQAVCSQEAIREAESVLLSLGYNLEEISACMTGLFAQHSLLEERSPNQDEAEFILRMSLKWLAQQ